MPSTRISLGRSFVALRSLWPVFLVSGLGLLAADMALGLWDELSLLVLFKLLKTYCVAGFVYAAWTQATGRTESSLARRYLVESRRLFLYAALAGLILALLVKPLVHLLGIFNPGWFVWYLLLTPSLVLLAFFPVAAVGRDFMDAMLGMGTLMKRAPLLVLALLAIFPGINIGATVLSTLIPHGPGVALLFLSGVAQRFLHVLVLLMLVQVRVGQDREAEAKGEASFAGDAAAEPCAPEAGTPQA